MWLLFRSRGRSELLSIALFHFRSLSLSLSHAVCRKDATVVRLGDFNYGSDREHSKPLNVKVAEVFLHPNYSKKSLYNNIALVELDQSIDFTESIRPACLPSMHTPDVSDESVSMTGWPFKLYSVPRSLRHKQDMKLRKYNMNPVDGTECKQIFTSYSVQGMSNGITDTQICASIIMEDGDRRFKRLRPLEVRKNCIYLTDSSGGVFCFIFVRIIFFIKKLKCFLFFLFFAHRFWTAPHCRLYKMAINVCLQYWDYLILNQHLVWRRFHSCLHVFIRIYHGLNKLFGRAVENTHTHLLRLLRPHEYFSLFLSTVLSFLQSLV